MAEASQTTTPAPQPGGGGAGGHPRRRPYTRAEYRLLAALYPHYSAQTVADLLGRTRQSVYAFLTRHPELRKQGRP